MFNQQLFEARLGKRWSPEDASQKVGVSEKTYRRWEAGINIPQVRTFSLLLIAFGDKPGKPAKPEDLGYVLENGCIRLKTPKEVHSPTQEALPPTEEVSEHPTDDLVQAHEDMLESREGSQTPLPETTSKQEDAFASFEGDTDVITFVPRPESSPAALDLVTWLCDRANKVRTISTWKLPIQQLTAIDRSGLPIQRLAAIRTEIEGWERMIDEDHPQRKAFLSTRRTVLTSLILISDSILPWVRSGRMTPFITREFLDQCATSIMASHYLLKGDGLVAVEYTLSQYLEQLISLAKSPSPFQQEAAYLAAQGCCMMSIVNGHRRQDREAVTHCKQAVELAKVAGDSVLVAATYTRLGTDYSFTDEPQKYLEAYEEAACLIPKETERLFLENDPTSFPLRLQQRIYMGLANANARLGHVQEATNYLALANALPVSFEDDVFIPALDYDLSGKIVVEGQVYKNLGKLEAPDLTQPLSKEARALYKSADAAYGQPLPASANVRERSRVQGLIERAGVATILGNKDDFKEYLKKGVLGAKELESEARLLEAKKAWRAACRKWQGEDDVQKMDEELDL